MSSQSNSSTNAGDYANTPGAQLREARERRGQTVNEVAFALKLNPRQVTALEENDFDALPGMALVRGFMRNYARHLGIDAAPLLDGVQQMVGRGAVDLSPIRNAEGDLPSGGARLRTTRWSGWVVVVLIGIVLGGWYFDWFRTEPADSLSVAPPGASTSTPPVAAAGTSTLTLPPHIAAIEAPASVPPALPATPPENEESSVAASEAAADTPAPADAAGSAAASAEAGPADAETAAGAEAAAPAGTGQLSFRFNGESWVEVREAGGGIVHSSTNRAGSTRIVQGKPPFALIVGNSAQVSLEFDGKPINLATHTKGSVARFTLP